MSFAARCPFCHVFVSGVPVEHEGSSIACPRCENYFTLAATTELPTHVQRHAHSRFARAPANEEISTNGSSPPALACASTTSGEPADERSEGKRFNVWGVLAFLSGTVALLSASVPGAQSLIVPLACTGLVLAALGAGLPAAQKAGVGLVMAGFAVSTFVLVSAGFWPGLLHLRAPATDDQASANVQIVYHEPKPHSFQRLAPRESEWVDAAQDAVQQAGVRVRITGVAVGPVVVKDAGGRRGRGERSLVVRLRISNTGADRLVEYKSWSVAAPGPPRLEDSTGKSYALKNLDRVVGQQRHAWLPAAIWVDDVLVFESPAPTIDWLRLELPCAGVGLPGQFRLEIPRRLIAFQ
jgi:hypothetical protein